MESEFLNQHIQDLLVLIDTSAYSTPETYAQAVANAQSVINSSLAHTLNMSCLVLANVLSTGSGYGPGIDVSLCVGLTTAQCQNLQICNQLGTQCLTSGQLSCGQNGLATLAEPFCIGSIKTPTLADTLFTCNGLAIQCYLPGQCNQPDSGCIVAVEANSIFCTSSNLAGKEGGVAPFTPSLRRHNCDSN